MKVIVWIIVGAVFLLAGAFALFNSGIGEGEASIATVHFFGEHHVAVSLFGLICFGIGVFSVVLFSLAEEIRLRARTRRLRREIEAMRKEINALRNLPLAPEILAKEAEDAEEER